jgi:glycogen debranching enzyme
MQKMTAALGLKADPKWSEKAGQLKNSINQKFWQKDNKKYLYLFDKDGGCDHSEALGNCFSILFGIADEQKAHYILKNQKICPSGIPCLWPNYERYNGWGKDHFGRQSGTVWPFIQALWAEVAFLYNKFDLFRHELINLSENIVESQDCYEIFHPVSGKPYGGLQEVNGKIELWRSCKSQTWSATGFIRMILMGLLGMRFEPKGLSLQPHLPSDVDEISVSNIRYRKSNLNIKIVGKGNKIQDIKVNGQSINTNTIPYDDNDEMSIHIKLNSEFKDNYPIKNYNTFETVDFIKSVRS